MSPAQGQKKERNGPRMDTDSGYEHQSASRSCWLRFLLLTLLLAPLANTADEKKSALDKATLEAYVRPLFVWGPQVKVEVFDAKPASLPGMMEVRVRASVGNASQEELFYVTKDGQKLVRGSLFDVKENP